MLGRQPATCLPFTAVIATAGLLVAGCADDSEPARPTVQQAAPPHTNAMVDDALDQPLVVFLGDSLTAGYSLGEQQAFPALVGETLTGAGRPVRVVNAGVNGDTTAGGLARLDWLLRQEPDVLVVGLGGNDGLRGQDPSASEQNLRGIIERAQQAGVEVVLLGLTLPPNYGAPYVEQFSAIYPALADAYDVVLVPFLLQGVGGDPELNLPDGIHPNARGHEIVARTVTPFIEQALDRAAAAHGRDKS